VTSESVTTAGRDNEAAKGGATIVIEGDNIPPILMSAGYMGGTKLLGDPILHMH